MEEVDYNKIFIYIDGWLYWNIEIDSNKIKIGDLAGTLTHDGYIQIMLNGVRRQAHLIIWEMHNGPIPNGYTLDHIDRVKHHNKLENLRLASVTENRYNTAISSRNTSGYKGVYFDKRRNKWVAQITVNKKQMLLGRFEDPREAAICYNTAAEELHGEYACLNEIK
jgi:hypothetical protein